MGVLHSMLFVADIHVASFGADQFSFGTTEPASSAIVLLIVACTSGHERDGSAVCSLSSLSSFALKGLEGSRSLPSAPCVGEAGEEGSTIPSERRYSRNGGDRGIRRALGVSERYLATVRML